MDELKVALAELKQMGFKTGVAINPETSVNVLKDLEADQYLVMSVVPGKQGQSFISETINRVKELRKLLPTAIIEVDGGINLNVAKEVSDAGVDLIVAGSAILGSENPVEAFEELKRSCQYLV